MYDFLVRALAVRWMEIPGTKINKAWGAPLQQEHEHHNWCWKVDIYGQIRLDCSNIVSSIFVKALFCQFAVYADRAFYPGHWWRQATIEEQTNYLLSALDCEKWIAKW